jgi:hypothetical protein
MHDNDKKSVQEWILDKMRWRAEMNNRYLRPITIFVFAALVVSGVWASGIGDIWANLTFGIASRPEDNGNVTEAYIRYPFTDFLSAQAKVFSKTDTTGSPFSITNVTKSLNMQKSVSNEFFVYPIELSASLAAMRFWLSAGLYVSIQELKEAGYFLVGTTNMFSYDDVLKSNFYGPLVSGAVSLDAGFLQLAGEAGVVPWFAYDTNQIISIDPTSLGTGNQPYNGSGYPYVFAQLRPKLKLDALLGIDLSADVKYEYFHLSLKLAQPNSGWTGWDFIDTVSDSHTVTAIGNINIPLPNQGYAILGVGQKFQFIQNAGIWTNKQSTVFNIQFDLSK